MLTLGLALSLPAAGPGAHAQASDHKSDGTLFRQGLIFVRVTLENGPEGLFLLDTGAQETVIDSHFAAQARLHLGRRVDLEGRGGDVGARRVEGVMLRVLGQGPLRLSPTVTDLSPASQAMGLSLAGILGDDILTRFVVTLDYSAGQASLTPPQNAPAPPSDAVSIRFASLPFVRARVSRAGRIAEGEFQIDTGSNTAVEFWRPFAARAFPEAKGQPDQGLGVAGSAVILRDHIDALDIAGRRTGALSVNLADQTRPKDAGEAYAGVIGGPAWAGLILTLDFPRGRLWLR